MKITVDGLEESIEDIEGRAERVEDLFPALESISERVQEYLYQRVVARVGPDGSPWPEATAETRRRHPVSSGKLARAAYSYVKDDAVQYGYERKYAWWAKLLGPGRIGAIADDAFLETCAAMIAAHVEGEEG